MNRDKVILAETIKTSASDTKVSFRVTDDIHKELKYRANRSARTMNAEILLRLVKSLKEDELIIEAPHKD